MASLLLSMSRSRGVSKQLYGHLKNLFPTSPSKTLLHSLQTTKLNNNDNRKKKKKKKKKKDGSSYTRDLIGRIYRTLKYSSWDSAVRELENLPVKYWDSYTVNKVLKSHPPMEKAWLFFNWVSNHHLEGGKGFNFKHDHFTYTTMLNIFGEAGRISSMKHLFNQMQEKGIKIDSVTYTSIMHWLSNSGKNVDEAIHLWDEMKSKGCHPTVVSYTAYIKILFDNHRLNEATLVYKQMLHSGCVPNCYTYTILMAHLIASGKSGEASEIFEKMQEAGVQPDKAACNILIEKCSKVGGTVFMNQVLRYMKENRIVLRYPVFVEALEALKIAGDGDMLLRQVNPHIHMDCSLLKKANEDSSGNIDKELLFVLLKNKNVVAIDHLLQGMMDKKVPLDSKIISTIIKVNCALHRPHGALWAFKYSITMGRSIERTGYLSLMGLLTRSNMFSKLVEIVEEMTRTGHSLGIYLASLLIYRLGCARQPTFASKIFNLLPDNQKCTATYTALISVYFSAGRVNEALKIYKIMCRKGICPMLGTYNVLISGLERNGRYSEAEHYRKAKKGLNSNIGSQESVSTEGKICNLFFAGDV